MISPPPARSESPASFISIWTALSVVYLVWGSTYLAIRFTVETIPPFLSAATRFIISGGILYTWRRLRGDSSPTRVEWRSAAIIGTCLLVGGNGGVVWAAQFISSSLTALLVATVPLWMLLIDSVRPAGKKPTAIITTGIITGFTGAVLLIRAAAEDTASYNPFGAAAVLLAGVCWAIGSLYGRTAVLPPSPLLATGMEMLCGGVIQMFIAFALYEWKGFDLAAISQRSVLALTYLTVIGSSAFVAYAWLLRVASTPLVSTYAYVNPLVAVLLGYFLAHELLTLRILLSAMLIIGSVALVSIPKK